MARRNWSTALMAGVLPWLAAAAAAQISSEATLTDEQVERLEKVIHTQGTQIALPPPIIGPLHLSAAQVAPKVSQATYQDETGVKHGFVLLNDRSGYLLFRRQESGAVAVYHVDRTFHLVDAVESFDKTRFMPVAAPAARNAVSAEIIGWSHTLSPRGVLMPPALKPAEKTAVPAENPAPAGY